MLKERARSDYDDDDHAFDRENRGGCLQDDDDCGCSKKFKKIISVIIIITTSFTLRPKVFESDERFFDEHEFRRVRPRRVRGEFR